MDNVDRTEVAFHEAGHAVIGWTFGLPIDLVSIVSTDEKQGGVTFTRWWEEGAERYEPMLPIRADPTSERHLLFSNRILLKLPGQKDDADDHRHVGDQG